MTMPIGQGVSNFVRFSARPYWGFAKLPFVQNSLVSSFVTFKRHRRPKLLYSSSGAKVQTKTVAPRVETRRATQKHKNENMYKWNLSRGKDL